MIEMIEVEVNDLDAMRNRNEIVNRLLNTERHGMGDMVNYLTCNSDFFTAPASRSHHLAYKGGLAEHSLSVFRTMSKLADAFDAEVTMDEIAISALLHDVCKTNYYVKTGTGWEVDDQLPLGHASKSVYIISRFINLTDAEVAAIMWHMGCWSPGVVQDSRSYNEAVSKYQLVPLLIAADFVSSRIVEK